MSMTDNELAGLALEVAQHLSAHDDFTWLVETQAERAERGWPGSGVEMRTCDGQALSLTEYPAGTVSVTGRYPATRRANKAAGIRVTASRGPAVIAGDIRRRLLPGYREWLLEVWKYEAAYRSRFAAQVAAVHEAEALFGQHSEFGEYAPGYPGERARENPSVPLPLRGRHSDGTRYPAHEFCRVTAKHDGSRLDLDLKDIPREVALGMLRVLAGYTATLPPAAE